MLVQQVSVVDAIKRAIHDHPDHGAIETGDLKVTYREFGQQIDELVSELNTRTAPGHFVGIEARRGASSVVAMVAALTAGRPFVLLDPRDGTASNASKVAALGITLLARPAAGSDTAELVGMPAAWHAEHGDRAPRSPVGVGLAEFAGVTGYAIHTSGSTGEPKCVLVAAEPLGRVVSEHVQRLSLSPQSRTLQFARLTFDGCITEILWTLTAGACLVVLEESRLAPGAMLQSTLQDFRITHLKTTPFALTATEPTGAMRLQHVVNGGGACRPAVVRKWSSVACFHNAYGTTETTVCNFLSEELTVEDCADAVPLGEVVGDCGYDIVALQAGDDPGPASGDSGELVITGNSVAIGYLTAQGVQRFVDAEGNKVYRTGDIVERRDGRLFFVERRDRQVKVRGYRLDPGEIESAACRLAGVVEAVVTAESHDGQGAEADALVCYYLGTAQPRAVRSQLEAVPDSYKVPSVIKQLETLPYTPNGKVDRDALRADRVPAHHAGAAVGPEEQVLDLVRRLTGMDDAGLDDNFFEIGGDSASTVILVNRLKELGWIDAGVRDVLRAENLKVLADELRDRSV